MQGSDRWNDTCKAINMIVIQIFPLLEKEERKLPKFTRASLSVDRCPWHKNHKTSIQDEFSCN